MLTLQMLCNNSCKRTCVKQIEFKRDFKHKTTNPQEIELTSNIPHKSIQIWILLQIVGHQTCLELPNSPNPLRPSLWAWPGCGVALSGVRSSPWWGGISGRKGGVTPPLFPTDTQPAWISLKGFNMMQRLIETAWNTFFSTPTPILKFWDLYQWHKTNRLPWKNGDWKKTTFLQRRYLLLCFGGCTFLLDYQN